MKRSLFFILACILSSSAMADDPSITKGGSAKKTWNSNRGSSTVDDVRLIMPNWGKPKPEVPPLFSAAFYSEVDAAPEGSGALGVPQGSTYLQYFAELDINVRANSTIYLRPMWNTVIAPENSRVSLAATPGHTTTKMGDTVIGWTEKNLLTWQSGGSVTGFTRFYAPTAESNRTTGQKGEFYLRGNVDQPINSWLRLWFDTKAWYAWQSQGVYLDPADPSQFKATFDKEVMSYFTTVITLHKYLTFYQSVGVDYVWMNGSEDSDMVAPQGYTMGYFDSSFGTALSSHVELRLGVNDEPTMNVSAPPKFFAPTEYFYYLWFVISI